MSERSIEPSCQPPPKEIPPSWKALAEACHDEELVDWKARCKAAGVRYATYKERMRRDSRWWAYLLEQLTPSDMERKVNVLMVERLLETCATTGAGMNQLALQAASMLLARDERRTGFRATLDISAGTPQDMQALQAAVALRLGPPPAPSV